jgi:hypothetical protein
MEIGKITTELEVKIKWPALFKFLFLKSIEKRKKLRQPNPWGLQK